MLRVNTQNVPIKGLVSKRKQVVRKDLKRITPQNKLTFTDLETLVNFEDKVNLGVYPQVKHP